MNRSPLNDQWASPFSSGLGHEEGKASVSVKQIPCFMDENKNVIQFFRLNFNPPSQDTHAVIINGVKVGLYNAYRYSMRGTITKAEASALLSQHVTSTTKGRGW